MATYAELRDLLRDGRLTPKIQTAIAVKAHAIMQEATPSAERLAWASAALPPTQDAAEKMLAYALAANKALTAAQILSASDAALQAAIDEAVDKLYS
jgi:hypothetical protein